MPTGSPAATEKQLQGTQLLLQQMANAHLADVQQSRGYGRRKCPLNPGLSIPPPPLQAVMISFLLAWESLS